MTGRFLARASIAVAVLAGLATHVTGGGVDPVRHMLSDSAVSPAGGALLGAACAALIVVAGTLAAAGGTHHRSRMVAGLLAVWAVALATIVLFPTNAPGTELTTTAVVHRWGAALTAVVPPMVGLLVARTRRLRTLSWLTAAAAAVFGAAHAPAVLWGAGVVPYAGLAERVLFGLILALLWWTADDLRPERAPAVRPEYQASQPPPEPRSSQALSAVHGGAEQS